ncbi:MAG TPA: FecR domain-containing protein [Candidatus Acidoferrales bacterium]|nr:FecR domain-containing protein [Candidatus Acidoferrales bacterium]
MRLSNFEIFSGLFLAGLLMVPAVAAQDSEQNARPPQVGSVNYVEGAVSLDGQALSSQDVGSAVLQAGQVLSTTQGRAEMLLTAGAFVRLDNNSAVELVSPSQNEAEIGLDRGRIAIEIANAGEVRVTEKGVVTDLSAKGLYEFDADRRQVSVFAGDARVNDSGREIQLASGRQVMLNGSDLQATAFDPASRHDDFYVWNDQRSNQLAQANQDVAPAEIGTGNEQRPNEPNQANTYGNDSQANANGYGTDYGYGPQPVPAYGPSWYGPGWYWDPYYGMYTWVPGDGLFYSPFGFGFYSPFVIYRTPLFYRSHFFVGGFGRFYGRGVYDRGFRGRDEFRGRSFERVEPRGNFAPRGGDAPHARIETRGGFATRGNVGGSFRGGFSGGSRGFSGGGSFHGGGGSRGGGHGRGH